MATKSAPAAAANKSTNAKADVKPAAKASAIPDDLKHLKPEAAAVVLKHRAGQKLEKADRAILLSNKLKKTGEPAAERGESDPDALTVQGLRGAIETKHFARILDSGFAEIIEAQGEKHMKVVARRLSAFYTETIAKAADADKQKWTDRLANLEALREKFLPANRSESGMERGNTYKVSIHGRVAALVDDLAPAGSFVTRVPLNAQGAPAGEGDVVTAILLRPATADEQAKAEAAIVQRSGKSAETPAAPTEAPAQAA